MLVWLNLSRVNHASVCPCNKVPLLHAAIFELVGFGVGRHFVFVHLFLCTDVCGRDAGGINVSDHFRQPQMPGMPFSNGTRKKWRPSGFPGVFVSERVSQSASESPFSLKKVVISPSVEQPEGLDMFEGQRFASSEGFRGQGYF